MQEQAVNGLQRTFLNVLMGPMNRVPSLESDNSLPALLVE